MKNLFKSVVSRIKSDTPPFFKAIRRWCAAIGTASGALTAYTSMYNIEMPDWFTAIIRTALVIGAAGMFFSSLATHDEHDNQGSN